MENDKIKIREKLSEYFPIITDEELIAEIADIGIIKKVKKGNLLIDIDDDLTHIPLITEGVIKVIREDNNQSEILLYYLDPGSTCAISFVNCINRTKSVLRGTVEKDAEFIMVPVSKIESWLTSYKSWRQFVIDSYHERLMEMVHAIENLTFLKLDERLENYLKEQSKLLESNHLNITHQEIANDLHTSRVVISRLLKNIENQGKIKLGRNKIKLIKL